MDEPSQQHALDGANVSTQEGRKSLPEAIIEPDFPIIDPHHHLQDRLGDNFRPASRYLLPELLEDINCGHNIQATVVVESSAMYRADGPLEFRPVGETEFANGIAAMSASGRYGPTRVCAGIVGFADLQLGERVSSVLEAHIVAGNGRFCGIRNQVSWDEYDALKNLRGINAPHMLLDPAVLQGAACLPNFNLPLDVSLYFTQLNDALALAMACPQMTIIIDHIGKPLHRGPYAGKQFEVFEQWKAGMRQLAEMPNVYIKIGGLGVDRVGVRLEETRPLSERLANFWRPYVETCIELFGSHRCMFESNFPPNKRTCSYGILWNAFKRIASQYTHTEKEFLFKGTAATVYHLHQI